MNTDPQGVARGLVPLSGTPSPGYFIREPIKAWVTEGLARQSRSRKKGARSQEIARTRRSQETIFGDNPAFCTLYPYTLPLKPNAFENARSKTTL